MSETTPTVPSAPRDDPGTGGRGPMAAFARRAESAAPPGRGTTPSAPRPPRRDARVLLAAHAAWGLLAVGALALPVPARGWAILGIVVLYVAGLPLLTRRLERTDWTAAWATALAISLFQPLPDWVLVDVAGTLRFPDLGGPRIADAVPLAMSGMWTVPLFLVLLAARGRPLVGAAAALGVFGAAELLAPTLALWEPVGDTTHVAGIALYVLPAEAALGAATVLALTASRGRGVGARLGLGAATSVGYAGALVVALLLVERAAAALA